MAGTLPPVVGTLERENQNERLGAVPGFDSGLEESLL
ncbi:MAG: hypothetical protein JWO82_2531 [Akkermansiaceae bacterium]|nr:hypothetical protein [Akkermansiaceae bacterium]